MSEFKIVFIVAQIFGLISVVLSAKSNFQKNKEKVLKLLIFCNLTCFFEYYLLGGISASYASILGIARAYIFYLYSKYNRKRNIYVLLAILGTTCLLGYISYVDIFSILPIVSSIIYTYGAWQDNLTIYRITSTIGPLIWIFYDIKISAFFGILTCLIEMFGAIIAIIKIDVFNLELDR